MQWVKPAEDILKQDNFCKGFQLYIQINDNDKMTKLHAYIRPKKAWIWLTKYRQFIGQKHLGKSVLSNIFAARLSLVELTEIKVWNPECLIFKVGYKNICSRKLSDVERDECSPTCASHLKEDTQEPRTL